MSFDLYRSLADLRSRWGFLHDLDRAAQVCLLLKAGVSRRTLARAIGVSEGLVRRLTVANEALAEEKLFARKGKLSTNQLVRSVRDRRLHRAARHQERADREAKAEAQLWATEITGWLGRNVGSGYAEQVVEEARRRLAEAELAGKLPQGTAPEGTPLMEIIARCKPKEDPDVLTMQMYCTWLTLWAYYAIPDSEVREQALSSAWERAVRGI